MRTADLVASPVLDHLTRYPARPARSPWTASTSELRNRRVDTVRRHVAAPIRSSRGSNLSTDRSGATFADDCPAHCPYGQRLGHVRLSPRLLCVISLSIESRDKMIGLGDAKSIRHDEHGERLRVGGPFPSVAGASMDIRCSPIGSCPRYCSMISLTSSPSSVAGKEAKGPSAESHDEYVSTSR